jgi:hypothetical protein
MEVQGVGSWEGLPPLRREERPGAAASSAATAYSAGVDRG